MHLKLWQLIVTIGGMDQIKKPWYKTWWGILAIVFFLWPFFLTYWVWKQNWTLKTRYALIGAIWFFIFIIFISNSSYQAGLKKEKQTALLALTPIASPTQSAKDGNCIGPDGKRLFLSTEECEKFNNAWKNPQQPQQQAQQPTTTPTPSDPYAILSKIGREGAGDNSNVSIFKNDDGSVDVINNIQLTPEVTWGIDAYTRKWITEFLSKSYTSGLNIRYVLVTVSFLNTGQPATRVGLGLNLAKKYTDTEWKEFTPYDLCKWLGQIQTGDDIDPGNPNYDPSDWAFAKNYKCN